jgi:hypothetical protein
MVMPVTRSKRSIPGWQIPVAGPDTGFRRSAVSIRARKLFPKLPKKRCRDQLISPGNVRRSPVSTKRNTARTMGELKKMAVRPAVTSANDRGIPVLRW